MGGSHLAGAAATLDTDLRELFVLGASAREAAGGEKPELTVCQVHAAVAALVPCWWLVGRASPTLIEHTATIIQHWQQRNATARKCHRKRTLKKLRKNGIILKNLIPCKWT